MSDIRDLVDGILNQDSVALGQAITLLDRRRPGYRELIDELYAHAGNAQIIGVTGSPGAGKSTIVNELVARYRNVGQTVGVLAIDPSSPFTGGAILGDRVRMSRAANDDGVFIRSMSTRGSLGGLSPATHDVIVAYDAFGMDRIIVETVGTGQNEIDIVRAADSVCVVIQPASGDDIQMLKAGILEIGDLFVVNKADLEGADRAVEQVKEMLSMGAAYREPSAWDPPVIETVAVNDIGIDALREEIEDHFAWLGPSGQLESRRADRYSAHIHTILQEELSRLVDVDRHLDGRAPLDDGVYRIVDAIVDPVRHALDDTEI